MSEQDAPSPKPKKQRLTPDERRAIDASREKALQPIRDARAVLAFAVRRAEDAGLVGTASFLTRQIARLSDRYTSVRSDEALANVYRALTEDVHELNAALEKPLCEGRLRELTLMSKAIVFDAGCYVGAIVAVEKAQASSEATT